MRSGDATLRAIEAAGLSSVAFRLCRRSRKIRRGGSAMERPLGDLTRMRCASTGHRSFHSATGARMRRRKGER